MTDLLALESIAYLKDKYPELHFDYDELMHEAHHKAFTVAKVTRLDLLSDLQTSLIEAQQKGQSFKSWKANIEGTLKGKGWWGDITVTNPKTGETKDIFVGSRRLKTIYDTNMRTSYAQGRYKSQMQSEGEYLRYSAVLDQITRPSHATMHGIVLPKDHIWWEQNYPPNGWHCRCKVQVLSDTDLKRRGLKVYDGTMQKIADKDWAYHAGKGKSLDKTYADKVNTLKRGCKESNARKRNVPCTFADVAAKAMEEDISTLAQRVVIFKAIKDLFTTETPKRVELTKSDIFGEEKKVLLSSDTVGSHGHHPEIGAFEYSLVPLMLKGRTFRQKENIYVIIKKLGKYYRVALKNIKDKDEIFVVSLLVVTDIEKELRKLSKFEEVKE
ncbi:MAG: phage minor head protein [Sulfurovum sp.]|nr:phage minor head protein [Sulfurovum sp.]